jgi:hypothetical protein
VRFDLNALTAALVTEPVLVPSSAAFTLAIVAASTSNEESTSRIDCTCDVERPDALTAGVAGVATGAVGAVVVVTAGDAAADDEDEDDEDEDELLLELLELLELELVVLTVLSELPPPPPEQMSAEDAEMVKVTVEVGSYLMND